MVVHTAELTLFVPFIRHHACLTIVDIPRAELRTIFRHSSTANIIIIIITARLHGSVAFQGTGNKYIISLGLKYSLQRRLDMT